MANEGSVSLPESVAALEFSGAGDDQLAPPSMLRATKTSMSVPKGPPCSLTERQAATQWPWPSVTIRGEFSYPLSPAALALSGAGGLTGTDRKSTRLNSSHLGISYAVFCLK